MKTQTDTEGSLVNMEAEIKVTLHWLCSWWGGSRELKKGLGRVERFGLEMIK